MGISFDRIRADIAEALNMAPDEISDDDNLYDLGIDSMRLMSLVLGWQDQGPGLDFGRLLESQTLGEWRAALDAQQ